jgi:ParB family chromosome partitioning protein
LLAIPGYDVAALVEKSGKSASHIYARLSLLQLIPDVAEAFVQERITASHANLIARLPQESQALAFEQCWRKDWQDKEPHLLPAKHLSAWIQANLYLALADAPFDPEDPTLNPAAGACVTCPRRSGYNTSLFCDVQGDQCLDSSCYQIKVEVHIDRMVTARPELVQIENGYRSPKEQRPGAIRQGQFREIESIVENPDAGPSLPCANTKTAIIVFGKHLGKTLTVCTGLDCPVHAPRTAARNAAKPASVVASATESYAEGEAEESERDDERKDTEHEEERQRRAAERKQQFERQQQEYEAERARKEELQQQRVATFDRILANAPAVFTAAQLRVFLHALITIDPYTFADDVAEHYVGEDENNQQTAEEILLSTLHALADDKLTGFGLRLVLTGQTDIPNEGEFDLLAEAEAAFVPAKPEPVKKPKKAKPETKAKVPA